MPDPDSQRDLSSVPAGDVEALLQYADINRDEVLTRINAIDTNQDSLSPQDTEFLMQIDFKVRDLIKGFANRINEPELYEEVDEQGKRDERYYIGGLMEHEVVKHVLNRISTNITLANFIPDKSGDYLTEVVRAFDAFFSFVDCYKSLVNGQPINIDSIISSIVETSGTTLDDGQYYKPEVEIISEPDKPAVITNLVQFVAVRTLIMNAMQAKASNIRISLREVEGLFEATVYDDAPINGTHDWYDSPYVLGVRGAIQTLDEHIDDNEVKKEVSGLASIDQRTRFIFKRFRADRESGVERLGIKYRDKDRIKPDSVYIPFGLYLRYVKEYGEATRDKPGQDIEKGLSLAAVLVGKFGGDIEVSKEPIIIGEQNFKAITIQIPSNISQT